MKEQAARNETRRDAKTHRLAWLAEFDGMDRVDTEAISRDDTDRTYEIRRAMKKEQNDG